MSDLNSFCFFNLTTTPDFGLSQRFKSDEVLHRAGTVIPLDKINFADIFYINPFKLTLITSNRKLIFYFQQLGHLTT